MAASGASADDDGIEALFSSSPDPKVHTSAAAETAFLLGLLALVSAPFSLMHAVSLCAGSAAVVFALVGLATTNNPKVAGRSLIPLGLGFAAVSIVVVGLRYLGLDTAFGDMLAPTISGWLDTLNTRFGADVGGLVAAGPGR